MATVKTGINRFLAKGLITFSILIVILSPVNLYAETCTNYLGVVFSPTQSTKLCNFVRRWFGNITFDGTVFVGANTTAGADDGLIVITGGHLDPNIANGAYLWLYGNEYGGSTNGDWYLRSGDVASNGGNGHLSSRVATYFQRNSGGYQTLWTLDSTNGHFYNDPTNGGDFSLAKSGTSISIQEATASTSCMGVATPNGTTPVAITTSCAASGSRIFYSRLGAVANMGAISTTTAPSGSGFSFASVNGSDTLAGSVVYLIVKEAT